MNILKERNVLIEAKSISKVFKKSKTSVQIIKDLDLKIYEGDFTVIMGRSGAGKSTLLYCISAMDDITGGEVLLNNKDISNISEKEMSKVRTHDMSFIFQSFNLFNDLTLFDNIAYIGYRANKNKKEVNEKVNEILQKLDIFEVKDKYPNATVNVKEVKNVSKSFGNILLKAVISSLGFTLLYVIVKKITKGKAYEKMLDKAKNNTLFVVLSGAISILAFPALFVLLILLSVLGLHMITIPVAIVYMAFLIVFVMLSVYVIGCTIFEYTNKKYIKAEKLSLELVGVFFTFLSLNLICKIPKIGAYIYMAMVMIAVGIMIAYFLKGDNKTREIKK